MAEYTADDFEHAHFAMHPVTGGVASKGLMDWKCVLPGWYDTGDVSRLSCQQMADAGWAPVRMPAKQRRPLTADDITDRFLDDVHEDYFWSTEDRVRLDKPALRHALLDAVKRSQGPTRPEEKVEVVLRRYWSGDINGDDLADRIVEEMNR